MSWLKENKKLVIVGGIIVLVIATGLDLAFEGLFYQMLPETIQNWF